MNKVKTKYQCQKCNNLFSAKAGNYEKHIKVCDGNYKPFVKLTCCKYCSLSFGDLSNSERANHSRWCNQNPKSKEYTKEFFEHMRKFITEDSRKKMAKSIKIAHTEGKYKEAPQKSLDTKIKNGTLKHTTETKKILSEKALKSNHRRILRSTRKYTKKDGTEVLLDSSWEEALAIRLDELNIEWIRPNPIKWIDKSGKEHNYFPDFYLPKNDIYLDPKNPQVYKMSIEKIEHITKILPNLLILKTLKECKEFTI